MRTMLIRRFVGLLPPQHLIALAWRVQPERELIVCGNRRLTRQQARAQVEALAGALQALGVRPGDRVATLLPACPEAVYALFLPWLLGSIEVPLNPLLGEEELGHCLADSGARVVLAARGWCGRDYRTMLARLRPQLPALETVLLQGEGPLGTGELALGDLLTGARPLRRMPISPREIGRLSYTSGTTGLPKGVAHTREAYWRLAHPSVSGRLDLSLLRCLLLPFPPYHYAGWLGVAATFLAGGKVVLLDRPNPQEALALIQRERVTQVGCSPTLARLLLAAAGGPAGLRTAAWGTLAADRGGYDLSSLRRITLGSEPCPPGLVQALHERLHCDVEAMYGMTETGIISWTALGDPWQRAAETVGRPAPGSQVRIVDDEHRPLPAGERGEVAVRSVQMMVGYWGDPSLTQRSFDREGWFYTGDVGWLDGEGYLHLVDRKKDLVIRGGENVAPAEVERILEAHPQVRRAAVIGVPGALGEALWAYIEPAAEALTARDLVEHCRGRLAPYQIPDQVRLLGRLPTTATGKVKKHELRRLALMEGSHAAS